MSGQPSKRDVYRLLKRLKKSNETLSAVKEDTFILARSEAEGLVKVRSDIGGNPIILLSAGEEYLKKYRWRWWRYAVLVGGLIVTLDSAMSLTEQMLPCSQGTVEGIHDDDD